LVELAEKMIFEHERVIPAIKEKLAGYDMYSYKTFVLGCTHFPIYRNVFKEVLPAHIDIIDGSVGTIRYLRHLLEEQDIFNTQKSSGEIKYFDSGKQVYNEERLNIFNWILKEC
jgi:glutamate racemase